MMAMKKYIEENGHKLLEDPDSQDQQDNLATG
jgi:hypothetical protein